MVLREAFGKGAPLIVGLQPRNFKCMRDGQPTGVERFLRFVNQLQKTRPGVNVFFRPPDFLSHRFDRVTVRLELHEGGVATRFVEFVHVRPPTIQKLERFPLGRSNSVAAVAGVVGAFVGGKETECGRDEVAHLLEGAGRIARRNAFSLAKASSMGLKSGL